MYKQNTIKKWTKGCILPFPKKGNLRIIKNYKGITLTAITPNIYNALLLNHIQLDIEKILTKNQNGFWSDQSTTSQILTICWIIKGVYEQRITRQTPLFVDFSKAFDSIHREKMKQILFTYGLLKESYCYNDALPKHKSNWWRHQLLWNCCWSLWRWYISTIFVYIL